MADAAQQKARREARDAQAKFVRDRAATQKARRKAFAKAQKAGLTLRDIAEAAGLHHSRVAEIIKGQ
jgi:hypothetical protein